MAIAWPLVRAALASNLLGVVGSSVTVYDGPVVSGDNPRTYLTVADQPSSDDLTGGSFAHEVGPDGFSAVETGTVLCELGAVSGDATVPNVFDTFGLIATYLQTNQSLGGVLSPGSTVTASADVQQGQTQSGAVERLLISITYFTRI